MEIDPTGCILPTRRCDLCIRFKLDRNECWWCIVEVVVQYPYGCEKCNLFFFVRRRRTWIGRYWVHRYYRTLRIFTWPPVRQRPVSIHQHRHWCLRSDDLLCLHVSLAGGLRTGLSVLGNFHTTELMRLVHVPTTVARIPHVELRLPRYPPMHDRQAMWRPHPGRVEPLR